MAETPRTTGKKAGTRSSRKKTTTRAASATPKTPRTRSTSKKKTTAVKRTSKKAAPEAVSKRAAAPAVSLDERRKMIAEAAFYKAASRGFVGGSPDGDWLEAEAEIDAMLLGRPAEDA